MKNKHTSLKKYTNWAKLSHVTQVLEFTSWPTSCGPKTNTSFVNSFILKTDPWETYIIGLKNANLLLFYDLANIWNMPVMEIFDEAAFSNWKTFSDQLPRSTPVLDYKSDNLQYKTLVCWDKWLVNQLSKLLSIIFFHDFLQNSLQKWFQCICYLFFSINLQK